MILVFVDHAGLVALAVVCSPRGACRYAARGVQILHPAHAATAAASTAHHHRRRPGDAPGPALGTTSVMKCPSGLRSVTTMSVWSPAWISPLRMTCGASISGRVASSPTTRGHHARGCRGGDAPARDQLAVGVVQHGRKPLALLERPDHRSCARQRAPASSLTLAQHARPAAACGVWPGQYTSYRWARYVLPVRATNEETKSPSSQSRERGRWQQQ